MSLTQLLSGRRAGRATALSLCALAVVAGCGPKTPANQGHTLKFLSMDYDAASSARQKAIVDAFNKANPGETVQIEITNWNDAHQKLQTLISGNQAPDLAIVGTRWMNEYAASNLLADLSAMDQHGMKSSEFIGPVLDTGKVKGKQVGLPCAASVRGLYYNEAMLAKAGVKPPKTWADLLAIAPKIQAANPGVNAIGIQGKEVETDLYFYYFLWGAGGDIMDASGQCALTSPAAKEALAFELGLVKKGFSEPQPTGYNRENLQDLFKAKKIAMVITGPWFAGMLRKDVPDLKFGVSLIPGKTGPVVPAVTDVMVMFNSCANKDLAWKFLSFWYRDDNRAAWDKDSGMLPEKQTVANLPEMKADATRDFFTRALPQGKYVPTHPRWEQMSSAISSAIQAALVGQSTPDAALGKACADVNGMK